MMSIAFLILALRRSSLCVFKICKTSIIYRDPQSVVVKGGITVVGEGLREMGASGTER